MPHLLDIQRNSYQWFLDEGLQDIFNDISPIQDFSGNLVLSFESFSLGEPKYELDECKERDVTLAAPIRVNVALSIVRQVKSRNRKFSWVISHS